MFDVTAEGAALDRAPRCRKPSAPATRTERDTICRMLADCRMLLVAKIGVAPQEKLAGAGIEASDLHAGKADRGGARRSCSPRKCCGRVDPKRAIDASRLPPGARHAARDDMDRSIDFYTGLLGMQVLERRDHKKNQFTQAYLGYGGGFSQMVLELVSNWTREEPYAVGRLLWPHRHSGLAASPRCAIGSRRPACPCRARREAQRHGEQHRRLHRGPGRPPHRTGAAARQPNDSIPEAPPPRQH